jgi:hypothetical protein
MMDWAEHVQQVPLAWLLERENPSVRALTLTELLDRGAEDEEVVEARQMIADAPYAAQILAGQHPEGHWGTPEHYFHKHTGTAWRWLLLHELGFDPMHPQMRKAADFLLHIAFNEAQGAFSSHPSTNPVPCYNGWLLWGLHRSGYGTDPRVRSALRWVVDTMRYDDGDDLAELPEESRSEETERVLQAGVEFLLLHRVYKRSHDPSKPMNAKLTQLTFPGFYWPDFVEVLLVLTRLGCRDPRMEDAIAYLQRKQSRDGTWKLQRTYNERSKHDTFPVVVPLEARGAPSKWVTLRALVVLKRWFGAQVRS